MEIVTSNEAKNEATPRHGWFYAGKLALVSLIVLLTLVTLKLLTEHRLAPKNAGLQGALAQPRLDLLLIGSSHTRKSYDMRLLERETGISSSFLISYDNADLSTMAQMLDTMAATLDRCPRHVVVEAYSAMLGRAPDLQDPLYFLDAPPSLKLRIIQSYFANHKSPGGVLDLFDLVVNRGNDEIVSYPVYIHALKMASYKGGRTDFYFPGMTAEAFRNLQARLNGTDPDPLQVAALNHILDLAARLHFQVLFVDTPMPRPVTKSSVERHEHARMPHASNIKL